ncbi:MAG: carboxylesterase family protein [Firmicutes bacterium]|nr:carboxylesterase family protein [Bacillota bacterium]
MKKLLAVILTIAMMFSFVPAAYAEGESSPDKVTKVSTFGAYEGFYDDEDLYPGAEVHNVYVEVPAAYEGAFPSEPTAIAAYKNKDADPDAWAAELAKKIQIAVTYVLPADAEGKAISGEKYPALIQCVRYDTAPSSTTGRYRPGTDSYYIERGYVVMRIDLRGMGASGGVAKGFGTRENGLDVAYIMEKWLPTQPWYSGKCAMYGASNQGVIGNTTAVNTPEGMAGYQVGVASIDYYSQKYNNGVSISNNGWGAQAGILPPYSVDTFTNKILEPAGPDNPRGIFPAYLDENGKIMGYDEWITKPTAQFVDDDPKGLVAYENFVKQQTYNEMFFTYMTVPNMYRDSVDADGWEVYEDIVLYEEVGDIKDSGMATYNYGGYQDIASTAQLAMATLTNGHMVISNGNHGGAMTGGDFPNFDSKADFVRYFDWLLKGVDNGFGDTPLAYYYMLDTAYGDNGLAPKDGSANPARLADHIPYTGTIKKDLYLTNTNTLVDKAPAGDSSVDYQIRTDISFDITGMANGPIGRADLSGSIDAKSISFTTEPLTKKLTYVGNGTMEIWASCANSKDFDLIGMLELVRADGTSHYLSRGTIRASHRDGLSEDNLQRQVWDTLKLSDYMHDSTKAEVEARQAEGIAEPTLLKFNLELGAITLNPGDALRVTLFGVTTRTGAPTQSYMYYNEDGTLKTGTDLPLVTFYTAGDHASKVTLPTLETAYNTLNGVVEMKDGSYNGPATMYMLEDNYYLQYNGDWMKLDKSTDKIKYTVEGTKAVFANAGFSFQPYGEIIADGAAQIYREVGKDEKPYAFPTTFEGCETQILAELRQGDYLGKENNGVYIWRGIQYSKAPLFEAPVMLPDKAADAEPIEAYVSGPGTSGMASVNEDCLDLSVYVNPSWDVEKDGPRAVFMWVFGSANMGGRVTSDWTNFVKNYPGIIVVTPTHRGGALGSIDLSVLEDYDDYTDASGFNKYQYANNLARLDILQVLKWINQNIADFGGDPNNVSIGGQSSGGNLCASVMMMPESKDLWKHALLQESFPLDGSLMPLDEAKRVAKNTYDFYNIKTVPELLAYCEEHKNDVGFGAGFSTKNPADFGYKAQCPVVDDVVIHSNYYDQLLGKDGLWKGKSVLFGSNDGTYDQMYTPGNDEANMTTARGRSFGNLSADGWYGDIIDGVLDEFLANNELYGRNGNYAAKDLDRDMNMRIPSILFAEAASQNTNVYFYDLQFNSSATVNHQRAAHGSENSVIMMSWVPNAREDKTAEERAVTARRIADIWGQFILTGDPNNADLGGAKWLPYKSGTRDTMVLGDEFKMVNGIRNEDTDVLLPLFREYSKLIHITGVPTSVRAGETPDLFSSVVEPAGIPLRATSGVIWQIEKKADTIIATATIKNAIVDMAEGESGPSPHASLGVVTSNYTEEFTIDIIPSDLVVELRQGDYAGKENNGVYVWRGIQYSKAPLFEAPVMLPDKAKDAPLIEAFVSGPGTSGMASVNEDCLDLSVYVNPNWDVEKDGPRAVFMWVFGSANMGGRVNSDWTNFVKNYPGIIVVTPTHRGGALGSIDLSVLEDYDDYTDEKGFNKYQYANNLARLDILQVLKWINQNIADFGGDPNNVSIGGQSSGGNLCASVMMMPESKDLWKHALLQESFPLDGSLMPLAEAQRAAKNTYDYYKIKTIPELLAYCEEHKNDVGFGAGFSTKNPADFGYKAQSPVIDGVVIPVDYYDQLLGEDGLWKGKSVLFGSNDGTYDQMYTPGNDEGNMNTARGRSLGNLGKDGWYKDIIDDVLAEFLAHNELYDRNGNYAAKDLDRDMNMRIPSILFAEAASQNTDVYFYELKFNSSATINHQRAAHGSENSVIMMSWVPNARGEDTAEQRAVVARRIADIWGQFIQTGDPNNADLGGATWLPYKTGTRDTMVLDNEFKMVNGIRNEDTDLLLPLFREYSKLFDLDGEVKLGEDGKLDTSAVKMLPVGPQGESVGISRRAEGDIVWTIEKTDEGTVARATLKGGITDVVLDDTVGHSLGVVTTDFVKDFPLSNAETQTATVTGISLDLQDKISIQFKIQEDENVDYAELALQKIDGTFEEPVKVVLENAAGGVYTVKYSEITTRMISQGVKLTVYDKNGNAMDIYRKTNDKTYTKDDPLVYSAADWCNAAIEHYGPDKTQKTAWLAMSVLNLGGEAQKYFDDYNPGNPANPKGYLADDMAAFKKDAAYDLVVSDAAYKQKGYSGMSLDLAADTRLRVKFNAEVEVTVDGKAGTLVKEGDKYVLDITGLRCIDLDQFFKVIFKATDGSEITMDMCALSWSNAAYDALGSNPDNQTLKLAKAVALYSAAAENYFK